MLEVQANGLVRGVTPTNIAEGVESHVSLTNRGELHIAQGLPPYAELVRLGNSWQILTSATTALTAVPSTTAGHSLWNGEPSGGKCYFIDSFGVVEIVVDATQQNGLAMFAHVEPTSNYAAPTDAGVTKASLSGRTAGQTNARTVAGATVTTNYWIPHGPASPGAAAVAGGAWRVTQCDVHGLYMVRPGGLFSVHAAKIAGTASQCRFFIRWHEIQVPYV